MTGDWSDAAFDGIARLVAKRTGLVFAPNRCESLERAVRQVMRERSLRDLREFSQELGSGALPWDVLIPQLTVGETYFFRDPEHFEFLRNAALPRLAELRAPEHRLRAWSAGCATGEEAYSLAITLAESGKLHGAFLLATDLSRAALGRARTARYKKWSLRGLDPRLFEKYFRWLGAEAVLAPEIAAPVTFQELNLASVSYPSAASSTFAMDLILCRNVLIYLSRETIASVARRFFDTLAPGGFLITGPSDPLLSDAGFEIEMTPTGIVYRRPVSAFLGPLQPASPAPTSPGSALRARASTAWHSGQVEPGPSAPLLAEPLFERAMRAFERGEHQALAQLAADPAREAWLAVLAVRARARAAPAQVVEGECRSALLRHPLSAELQYLHALTLLELSAQLGAAKALRRAIYLEPGLAIAHFTLGAVLSSLEDPLGAERAYRNAAQQSQLRPADEPVRCAPEIRAGGLAQAALRELALLRARSAER